MLLIFERGIRGGITQSVYKWAIVNNPYMGCEYDPLRSINYLQYQDANNLYSWAMSQPLPTGEFKWVDIENLKQEARELKRTIDMMVRNSNRGVGYVLEVDVKYTTFTTIYHSFVKRLRLKASQRQGLRPME